MRGHITASEALLRIVMARCRMLGWFDLRPLEPFSPRTVVLTAEDLAQLGL